MHRIPIRAEEVIDRSPDTRWVGWTFALFDRPPRPGRDPLEPCRVGLQESQGFPFLDYLAGKDRGRNGQWSASALRRMRYGDGLECHIFTSFRLRFHTVVRS